MVQPIRPQDASGIYRRQVTSAEAAEAAANARRNGNAAAGRRTDQVSLSEGAREFARIMDAVKDAPEARTSRVDDLKSRIENGQYEVDYYGLASLLHDRGIGS